MKVSFIVPVYNCEAYLRACVSRLLRVDGPKLEILLIDDGSTDGSGDLCDRLCQSHPEIRTVHQPNGGVSAARNRGIEEASGDYLAFIDADDAVEADQFSLLISAIEKNGTVDMALYGMSFDYYFRGRNYRSEQMACVKAACMDRAAWGEQVRDLFGCNYLSPVWNKLFCRDLLITQSLRFNTDLFLLEDLDFSVRCLACCQVIVCSDQVIYRYRQPEDEGNAGRRLKRVARITEVADKLRASFRTLARSLQKPDNHFDDILTRIFLMLAREKVIVSDRTQIGLICDDFSEWTRENRISPALLRGTQAQNLLNRRITQILRARRRTRVRHWAANRVKYCRYRLCGGDRHARSD